MKPFICHLNFARGYRGGERQTELLIRALAEMGYSQRFIGRKGAPLYEILSDCPKLTRTLVSVPYCKKFMSTKGSDIIQVHEPKGGVTAYFAKKLLGVPYVLTRRTFAPPKKSWKNRLIYREASEVVSVSAMIGQILAERKLRTATAVIPDAIAQQPVDKDTSREIRSRFQDRFLIGHAAALVPNKGQLVLIEAMKELEQTHPQLHLIFLGQGPDEDMLRNAAKGLSNITFEGHVKNLGDYFAALDLYVHPSLQEGLGSVILDAMSAGLRVIASSAGGIPEIVVDKENGILIEPGSPKAALEAIKLMVEDSHLRGEIAGRAEQFAKDYTPQVMARHYDQIYQSIL